MNPFDELTLQEVDDLVDDCLGGVSISDSDPIKLAGAVMFMHSKRAYESLTYEEFKRTTKMADIKVFSESMNEETVDPTNGQKPSTV